MTRYINSDARWGDPVEVTPKDYHDQGAEFGRAVEVWERPDGLYIDGERVARVMDDEWHTI